MIIELITQLFNKQTNKSRLARGSLLPAARVGALARRLLKDLLAT